MIATLKAIASGRDLNERESFDLMTELLGGSVAPEQVGALIACLNFGQTSGAMLTGFVKSIRAVHGYSFSPLANAIDVCGTGGDGLETFNVSTAVAFVVAAAGQPVAKHGSRSVSSRCGSFDVLEALGIPFANSLGDARESLLKNGLTFLYAPSFYPKMKNLNAARKLLGFRTVFNVLGPLLNPLGVERQLVGVYSNSLLVPVAEAFQALGAKNVMVVHGQDGSDEFSLFAPTKIAHLVGGLIRLSTFDPASAGFDFAQSVDVRGGSVAENAMILDGVFSGKKGAPLDLVALNSAAALVVSGQVGDIHEGLLLAKEVLLTGEVMSLVNKISHKTSEVYL